MTRDPSGLVLVTGASGFVGAALVPELAARGWRVRAAARNVGGIAPTSGIDPALLPDLAADPDWRRLLDGVSHVVHLAGIAHSRAPVAEAVYHRVNAEAAGSLARAAARAGVQRLVFVSSVRAQSGPVADHVLTESNLPQPTDAYGRAKLAGEALVRAELGPAAAILRPMLVVGPGVKGNLAALARLARSPLPLPLGALTNRRSLVGLGNLVSAIAFALDSQKIAGGTFLVSDPEPLTVARLLTVMRSALGRPPGLVAVPPRLLSAGLRIARQGGLSASLLGDLIADGSALAAAGWRAETPTEAEIARMMGRAGEPS